MEDSVGGREVSEFMNLKQTCICCDTDFSSFVPYFTRDVFLLQKLTVGS